MARDVLHHSFDRELELVFNRVSLALQRINMASPADPAHKKVSDKALGTLIDAYCTDIPESADSGPCPALLLDLDKMKSGARFIGQFEQRLSATLEGLAERGGQLGGRKVTIQLAEPEAIQQKRQREEREAWFKAGMPPTKALKVSRPLQYTHTKPENQAR